MTVYTERAKGSPLADFLVALFETGRVKTPPPNVAPAFDAATVETLQRIDEHARRFAPGGAPAFDLQAAQWAAGVLFRACQFLVDRAYPLGLRREALRTVARLRDGGLKLLDLAREKTLPDDLKTEATTVLHGQPDRRVRDLADELLPLPKSASGRPLPSIFELIRREGDAGRGEVVFFREGATACGSCSTARSRTRSPR